MPHGLAGRRREAGDVGDDRLRHLRLDEGGGLLLLVATDLAHHDHLLGLRVGLEQREHLEERRADDRIAADPDDRRVPEPELRELVPDLVGQRPRARHEPYRPLAEDLGRNDPDVGLPRGQRSGAVRPDQAHVAALDERVETEHLVRGNTLGDADDRPDPRVDRLVHRVGGERRRHEDHRGVRAGLGHRRGHGVEDRDPLDVLAALARRDACDDVRAVRTVSEPVESPLRAGEALHDEARLRIDEDRHQAASSTARRAPSSIVDSA